MPIRSHIVDAIDARFERCCLPHHHARITARWHRYASLTDVHLAELRAALISSDPSRNPQLADLHRSDDSAATTVLLSSLVPFVYTRATSAPGRRCADSQWNAYARLLRTIDTDEIRSETERGYLKVLAGRVRRDAARLRTEPTQLPFTADLSPLTSPGLVEDAALARFELHAIKEALDADLIPIDRWRQLVEHRVTPTGVAHPRSTVCRTANQLAITIGHVA